MKLAEQGVDRGVPGLMRGGVGEQVRPDDVADRIDVREERLQPGIGLERSVGVDAERLEAVAGKPRLAADRDDELVEREGGLLSVLR